MERCRVAVGLLMCSALISVAHAVIFKSKNSTLATTLPPRRTTRGRILPCQDMIDDPYNNLRCQGGGSCLYSLLDGERLLFCECPSGRTGKTCEEYIDRDPRPRFRWCIDVNPCRHNSTCIYLINGPREFKCVCTVQYTGEHCERRIKNSSADSGIESGPNSDSGLESGSDSDSVFESVQACAVRTPTCMHGRCITAKAGGSRTNQRKVCSCNAGYQGGACNVVCQNNTYGSNCDETCGRCASQPCHHVNGNCPSGECRGTYKTDRCDQRDEAQMEGSLTLKSGSSSSAAAAAIETTTTNTELREQLLEEIRNHVYNSVNGLDIEIPPAEDNSDDSAPTVFVRDNVRQVFQSNDVELNSEQGDDDDEFATTETSVRRIRRQAPVGLSVDFTVGFPAAAAGASLQSRVMSSIKQNSGKFSSDVIPGLTIDPSSITVSEVKLKLVPVEESSTSSSDDTTPLIILGVMTLALVVLVVTPWVIMTYRKKRSSRRRLRSVQFVPRRPMTPYSTRSSKGRSLARTNTSPGHVHK